MKLPDAKKILSGELVTYEPYGEPLKLLLWNDRREQFDEVTLRKSELDFALRQLSLKVEREHKKERE